MDDTEVPSHTTEASGPPGSEGTGLGGRKDTGPAAGSGPGGPEREPDDEHRFVAGLRDGVTPDGPSGPQDSSVGDLDEPG
jgi:hypothetical protein